MRTQRHWRGPRGTRGPRRQAVVTHGLVVCVHSRIQASNNVFGVSQSQEQDTTAWSDHEDMVFSESKTHKATQWGLHNRKCPDWEKAVMASGSGFPELRKGGVTASGDGNIFDGMECSKNHKYTVMTILKPQKCSLNE